MILSAVCLSALLGATVEFVRKPIDFTDTLKSYSYEKADGNYALQFTSNYVTSAKAQDSSNSELIRGTNYHVLGYENILGKHVTSVERIN